MIGGEIQRQGQPSPSPYRGHKKNTVPQRPELKPITGAEVLSDWMEQAVVTGPPLLLEMANDKRPAASARTKMMGLGKSHSVAWGTILATTIAPVGLNPPFAL